MTNMPIGNVVSIVVLIVMCAGAFLLAGPTMTYNIDDPNMVVYMNADEGGLMDIAWWYFSGQKRGSFQWDFDYGLEMRYLADIARVLSKWISFTPGAFVLILRWFHLFSWIGAIIALWYFVGYHFGKGWQQAIAVLLLATRHAFAYFTVNLKPEPLVLLIMIIGLHYSLKIVKDPSWRNLILATALASLAFIVKFAGAFLLTAIVFAMYFSSYRSADKKTAAAAYPALKIFWALPAIVGAFIMALTVLVLAFYVRKSTGMTWVRDLGLWESLAHNKLGLYVIALGACGIVMSIAFYLMAGAQNAVVKKIVGWIKEISSYALIALGIFAACTVIFGFRWILDPKLFITTYAFLGTSAPVSESLATIPQNGFVYVFFHHMASQIREIDPVVVLLFVVYLIIEAYNCLRGGALHNDRIRTLKRFTLLVFLIPAFGCIFSPMRLAAHHMLPFFVAISVLSLQGVEILFSSTKKKVYYYVALAIMAALLLSDVGRNGVSLVRDFVYRFGQSEDVAHDVASWWRVNMPKDAVIVAEEYNRSYIPEGYKNIIIFKSSFRNRNDTLRELIMKHHPEYIYYNAGWRPKGEDMPAIEKIIPEFKFTEAVSFDSSKKRYERMPGARYVIYKVSYDQGVVI